MSNPYNNPETIKPMGLDLPPVNYDFNFKETSAVLGSVIALASFGGIAANSLSNPEKASAAVDCAAPTGEVSQPNIAPPHTGPDISLGSIAASTSECVGKSVVYTSKFRNIGNDVGVFTFHLIGRPTATSDINSINFGNESWAVIRDRPLQNGEKACRESDTDDRYLKPTKQIVCGSQTVLYLWAGQEMDISFTASVKSPKTGGQNYFEMIANTSIDSRPNLDELDQYSSINNHTVRDITTYTPDGSAIAQPADDTPIINNPPVSSVSTCKVQPTMTVAKRRDNNGFNVVVKPQKGQIIYSKGNGLSTSSLERSKSARVSIYIPKGSKIPNKLPKNMKKFGKNIIVDLTKNISQSRYWKFSVPVRTNRQSSVKFFGPKGTIKGCESKDIVMQVRSTKAG